jgi:phosphoribosylamine--glycine ligase
MKKVKILMGSDSDWSVMQEAEKILREFQIPVDAEIASAHRSPERVLKICQNLENEGYGVVICGAGMAAHLAGVVAAHTDLPVIGVPLDGSSLQGLDALLATVQMPPGIPVATMAVGKAGARNAGVLAAKIFSVGDEDLRNRLKQFRKDLALEVEQKNKKLFQP